MSSYLFVDECTLSFRFPVDLITSLMAEWDPVPFDENASIARVLFVGLYRSDEVDHNHILSTLYFPAFNAMPTIEVHFIMLLSMTKKACNSIISYALRLPIRLTQSLADVVHAKTLGNVFYIKMFVESLVINKTLSYSLSERRWVWHLDTVKSTPIAENVAQLMTRNLQVLPVTTIRALKVLSCFGSNADESILLLLDDHINMMDHLAVAIDRNIIEKHGQVYRFAHDILEQGLYDMMSRLEQSNNHLLIGLELIKEANQSNGSHFRPVTFIAIDQINRAKMLGNPQLSYSIEYANLNLKVAESSMSVSDFASALSYAEHGISFLADYPWYEYKLSLRLHETASKACFTSYQGDKMRCFLDEIFKSAKCLQDKLSSHLLLIETLVLMGKDGHAIDSACSLLEELGETSPQDVPPALIYNEVVATKNTLQRYSDYDIKNSPRVSDWNINARMRVLGSILPALFTSQPQYHSYVACRIVNLSIQHGEM
jgi:predicted ATPase